MAVAMMVTIVRYFCNFMMKSKPSTPADTVSATERINPIIIAVL